MGQDRDGPPRPDPIPFRVLHGQLRPSSARQEPPGQACPLPVLRGLAEDEAAIPARAWVGGHGALPLGRVTVVSGAPGAKKSTLAASIAACLAAGLPFGAILDPPEPARVLFACVEDEIEEVWRRIHAFVNAWCHHPIDREQIRQNLGLIDLAEAVPLYEVDRDGTLLRTEAADALEATIASFRPAVVILDPLIELHTAEENSNTLMRPVLRELRSIAHRHGVALVLLHHETKAADGTPLQRLRGAGAIGGTIRALYSLRQMTAEEAREFGIAEENADLYTKVETGKQQYARAAGTRWFVAEERTLANGDRVACMLPWTPPRGDLTVEMLAAAARAVRDGVDGEPLCESNRSQACYINAFVRAGLPRSLATKALDTLKADGSVVVAAWRDPRSRKVRERLRTVDTPLQGWVSDRAP